MGTWGALGIAADLPSFEVTIVEEKAVVGTWPVLAIPFPPCLSRKRQSWEHGVCLRFPFPPSCRGNDNHGNTPCACETLFPLPDKEKAVVGCLRFAFPFACRRKGLPRDSAGLRGWGAHGALQGSVAGVRTELRRALKGSAGLCKASWLGIAFPSTGRGKWPSQARSGVSSISRLREAPFPRQAEGKGAGAPQSQNPPPLAPAF